MKNKTKKADYQLESVNVRVAENGHIVSCEKRIVLNDAIYADGD